MPKVDLPEPEPKGRTGYPSPYDRAVAGRQARRLAPATGLTDFGVNHVVLDPGAWASQRHWHEGEDEFLVMLAGEAVLIEEGARTVLRAGDMAAFPKDVANGHHLVNESDRPCAFVVIGRDSGAPCHYPGIDLLHDGVRYCRRDGSPY